MKICSQWLFGCRAVFRRPVGLVGGTLIGWVAVLLLMLFPMKGGAAGTVVVAGQQAASEVATTEQGAATPAAPGAEANLSRKVITGNPGPWGEIEYNTTFLQAPDSLIELLNVPSMKTVWRFPGLDKTAAIKLLESCEPGSDWALTLLDDSHWDEDGEEGVRLFLPVKAIVALDSGARQRIYRELGRWKQNPYHWSPLIIESGTVREWFADSGLREKLISEIENLAYPIGDSLAFSDLPYLIGWSQSDEEDRQIMKMMTRAQTLMLRLRLGPDTNLAELRNYWSMGEMHSDAIPMLENLVRSGEEDVLDVTQILPHLPRKLLYTFPSVSMGVSGNYPDGLWTAANFLTYDPVDSSLRSAAFRRIMEKHYDPVEDDYRFGDVLLLRRGDGKGAMRACVYIADNIVYTKIGKQMSRPWVLTKLDRVVARVRRQLDFEPTVEAWRRRSVPSTN